jgi:flavorubredoxin
VFSLVEPDDVRWIFLSHDDRDHSGNLLQVLDACPNATLLTNWFSIGRMAEEWMTPMPRCRFLNEGDRIDLADRALIAVRPPLFDNPTTRGLVDTKTVPRPMETVDDLDEEEFVQGQQFGARLIAPWHVWLDNQKFSAHVEAVRSLPINVIASCHGPAIHGDRVAKAFDLLGTVSSADPWQPFTQADLEMWMAAMPS